METWHNSLPGSIWSVFNSCHGFHTLYRFVSAWARSNKSPTTVKIILHNPWPAFYLPSMRSACHVVWAVGPNIMINLSHLAVEPMPLFPCASVRIVQKKWLSTWCWVGLVIPYQFPDSYTVRDCRVLRHFLVWKQSRYNNWPSNCSSKCCINNAAGYQSGSMIYALNWMSIQ